DVVVCVDAATAETSTLSLHDALPILVAGRDSSASGRGSSGSGRQGCRPAGRTRGPNFPAGPTRQPVVTAFGTTVHPTRPAGRLYRKLQQPAGGPGHPNARFIRPAGLGEIRSPRSRPYSVRGSAAVAPNRPLSIW